MKFDISLLRSSPCVCVAVAGIDQCPVVSPGDLSGTDLQTIRQGHRTVLSPAPPGLPNFLLLAAPPFKSAMRKKATYSLPGARFDAYPPRHDTLARIYLEQEGLYYPPYDDMQQQNEERGERGSGSASR